MTDIASKMLASYRDMIGQVGMPIQVRRYADDGSHADSTTQAYVRSYDVKELIGAIVQGDQVAICLIDTLGSLLPLVPGADALVIDGRECIIKNVKPRRVGETLIALEIQASG